MTGQSQAPSFGAWPLSWLLEGQPPLTAVAPFTAVSPQLALVTEKLDSALGHSGDTSQFQLTVQASVLEPQREAVSGPSSLCGGCAWSVCK